MALAATPPAFTFCSLTTNWWAFVLRGVLALIVAVLAALMPASALIALAIIFGAFSFVDGIFAAIAAVRNIRAGEKWGWLAFNGIVGILTGVVVVLAPFVATFVLALFLWWMIAFWSLASGSLQLITAVRLRKEIKGEVWLVLGGLLSIALGLFIVWMQLTMPLETFLALGWVFAFYAAFFGAAMLMLGFRLRRLARAAGEDEAGKYQAQQA